VLAHLPAAHLSDHPGGAEGLLSILKPGCTLPGPLLVLQQRRQNPNTQGLAGDRWQGGSAAAAAADDEQQQQQKGVPLLLLSRKGSLVAAAAAGQLPSSVAEVAAGAVLPGYVASVTRDAGGTTTVLSVLYVGKSWAFVCALVPCCLSSVARETHDAGETTAESTCVLCQQCLLLHMLVAEVAAGAVLPGYAVHATVFMHFLGPCGPRH
jgi:hypothetical protein